LDDADAQAASVAQRVIEFEGDQAVAADQVIDVVDTSSSEESAPVDTADTNVNNEKSND
jgi:segregation and condensation protein B